MSCQNVLFELEDALVGQKLTATENHIPLGLFWNPAGPFRNHTGPFGDPTGPFGNPSGPFGEQVKDRF